MDDHSDFSWTDTIKACFSSITSCLPVSPCKFSPSPSSPRPQRTSQHSQSITGELDRLLGVDEDGANSDIEDALSLHSNISPGSAASRLRQTSKSRPRREAPFARWFGISWFGRRQAQETSSCPHLDDFGIDEEVGRAQTSALFDISSSEPTSNSAPTAGSKPLTDIHLADPSGVPRPSEEEGLRTELITPADSQKKETIAREKQKEKRRKNSESVGGPTMPYPYPYTSLNPPHLLPPSNSASFSKGGAGAGDDFGPFGPVLPHLPRPRLDTPDDEEVDGMDLDAPTYTQTRSRAGTLQEGLGSGSGSRSRSSGTSSHSLSRARSKSLAYSHMPSNLSRTTYSSSSTTAALGPQVEDVVERFDGFDGELVIPSFGPTRKRSKSKSKSGSKTSRRSQSGVMGSGTVASSSNADSASLKSPLPYEMGGGSIDLGRKGVDDDDGERGGDEDEADRIHGF